MNKVFIVFEGNGSYSDRRETPLKAFASFEKAQAFEKELTDKATTMEAKLTLFTDKISQWDRDNLLVVATKPHSMSRVTWEKTSGGKEAEQKTKDHYFARGMFVEKTRYELAMRDDDKYAELDYFITDCELDSTL